MEKYNILIVGGGPTGLTLACALENLGIRAHIIDKRDMPSLIPRAINITPLTLEIFNKIGMGREILDEGYKLEELTVLWKKKRLLNINYKYVNVDYPYFFHLEQSVIEGYLNKNLNKLGNTVHRGVSLVSLSQSKDFVTVSLSYEDGRVETSHYSHVIGCDGGNSTVRKFSKIGLYEKNIASFFVLADVELDCDIRKLNYYLSDDGYLIIAPLPKNKFRLIASFKGGCPGESSIDLKKSMFQEVLDKRGPGNLKIQKIYWTTSSDFSHKLAENAKVGRIFLAGDALHQFSPIGGTNMNTGIQDAYDLAQKIFMSHDEHRENILDLYESERLSVANNILNATTNATHLMIRDDYSDADQIKYLPLMKNRNFIKNTLPRLFSGIEIQAG